MRFKKIIAALMSVVMCVVSVGAGADTVFDGGAKAAANSGIMAIATTSKPTAVSGLKLKGRAVNALRIGWNKNTSADGYIIEMKSGSTWTRVGKITKNTTVEFRKTGLKAGTAYSFRVKAYKMSGSTALYSGYTTISARTNPSAISGLKLKGRAADALRIAWTKNTSADGYIVEMKSGSKWVRVGKITKNTTVEFRKAGLKAGTAYSFRVKAYKMSGSTALYSGYTTISARTNPSAISGLKVKGKANNALRIAWTKNTSADGYIIEMKSGSTWTRVGKITKNSTVEFRKAGLNAGTSYSFRVKAYKMSGSTALYSGYKTVTGSTTGSSTTTVYETCTICKGDGKCTLCSGTAKCSVCFGEGGVWSYGTFLLCPNCSGTGICPYCEDGKCFACDGKGTKPTTSSGSGSSGSGSSGGSSGGSGSGSSGLPMIQTC